MSADVKTAAAAGGTPGYDSSGATGIPQMSPHSGKTILVVGLGMVGIGEHGFHWQDNRPAVIYFVRTQPLSRRFST